MISDIYEAAYDPSHWATTVEALRNLFQGSKACMQRFGPSPTISPEDTVTTNPDPLFHRLYAEEHVQEVNVLGMAVGASPVGAVYNDHELAGDALRRSRFWNEWMAPQDMYGGLGLKLLADGPWFWFLDVQRGRTQERFQGDDLELMRIIAPHFTRAVSINRQVQSSHYLASALDRFQFALLLVDSSMRIVTMNAAAEAILSRPGSNLSLKSGKLSTPDGKKMARLRALIASACSLSGECLPGLGGDLLIDSSSLEHGGIALTVAALPRPSRDLLFVERPAAILLHDVSLSLPPRFTDQVEALFGLSPREAELAVALASGKSLKAAAESAGIRITTARAYLEHVFHKTRTHQQSQLVALLRSIIPANR